MHIAAPDASAGEEEWRPFVAATGFGHLVAAGRDRPWPVVVPTQFTLDADRVLLHVAAPNPVLDALAERPSAVLSVAGDWAYIPSDWKVVGDEDPLLGIPTTYYAAVQLAGPVTVVDDPDAIAEVLRRQLGDVQPTVPVADPAVAHRARLRSIRALVLDVAEVRAKFKFGGNVDVEHRRAVAQRLAGRGRPGDAAAAGHTLRRSGLATP